MAGLLLIPLFLLRFGLLALLDRGALARAAHFPPVEGGERIVYWVYQLSSGALLILPFFLRIRTSPAALFWAGAAAYAAGVVLLAASIAAFAAPSESGARRSGVYRFSRNPMYVAYFLLFLGCAFLTQSPVLLGLVLVFQAAAHRIILAEERWCLEQFGEAYRRYLDRVRRYGQARSVPARPSFFNACWDIRAAVPLDFSLKTGIMNAEFPVKLIGRRI